MGIRIGGDTGPYPVLFWAIGESLYWSEMSRFRGTELSSIITTRVGLRVVHMRMVQRIIDDTQLTRLRVRLIG